MRKKTIFAHLVVFLLELLRNGVSVPCIELFLQGPLINRVLMKRNMQQVNISANSHADNTTFVIQSENRHNFRQ